MSLGLRTGNIPNILCGLSMPALYIASLVFPGER